ncbi:MAG: glycoside hydrolase family 95 protein [Clostridia bacterium]|nr:glycoside hydrolase family 95 protein [Clostridia bacterium]
MNQIKPSKDSVILFEKTEASAFEEAFPLGNGALGAMFRGGIFGDVIALNHDTLWSGYPRGAHYRGNKKESLDKAKALLREKKYVEADAEISNNFASYGSDAYMPMGELTVSYNYCGKKPSAYKRTLDLTTAVASASYKVGEQRFTRYSFVSKPADSIVYRTVCENGIFDVKVALTSQLYSRAYFDEEGTRLFLEGECPVTSEQNLYRTDRKTLYSDIPAERGIRFMCALCLITDGKVVTYTKSYGNSLEVLGATFIDIRIVARTSFNGYDKHPFLEGKEYKKSCLDALNSVYGCEANMLLRDHINDHKQYFSRVALDLGSSGKSRLPTSERLRRYQNGDEDKALPALLFNMGRYLTIASSRKGSQAINLQGIWNELFFAPWHSNYTVNINTEMNYFPTLAVSLPEMYEPMLTFIKEVSEAGKGTAKEMYGAEGWVCHHNSDLWRHTQPVAGMTLYLFWNACGAWLCHHLAEYYEYTLDENFLASTALPIMCECAEFYLSQLEDSEDGYRIIFASTSPENFYMYEKNPVAIAETTEMTMAAVRELFGNIVRFSKQLGFESDVTRNVENELPRLRPSVIGSDGRITEWYGEREEESIHHRHISHLYALHPGNEISPLTTPELADACRKTLEVRGDGGTGWSLAWKCNFFARLFDGDHALSFIKRQLRLCHTRGRKYSGGGGTYPNLFCACPPFQIDGNFGATSGICEMLLQSTLDVVHIIPALPSEWRNASVRGLSAKGNRKVAITVRDGELLFCEISGSKPKKIYIQGKDMTEKFVFGNGKASYSLTSECPEIL